MQKQLITLIGLTVCAFVVVQGMRVLSGEGWSWITTAGFGIAAAFQLYALWQLGDSSES